MGRVEPAVVNIAVFYAPERGEPDLRRLALPAGATVGQALQACGMLSAHPELTSTDIRQGIDGQRVMLQRVLRTATASICAVPCRSIP
jgi:Uncharacterised protein family (UPF0125).